MAIFHMQIKTVARAQGRNAPASAAYRAGELIRDERTGAVYDHRKRQDVLHKEIMLPSDLERASAPEWARDRASLWNAAERAEHQRNSRVAREYMVALPAELTPEQRVALARALSRDIADRFHVAVDLAVHGPRAYGDPRNFHAHLLATTRVVTPEGLGAKTGLDMQGTVRAELGLPTARQQFKALRERWAELANEALQRAHLAERIDHRSLAERGIDRVPQPNLPIAAVAALRRGERSEVAERLFDRYRQRVAERQAATGREPRAGAPPAPGPEGLTVGERLRRLMDQPTERPFAERVTARLSLEELASTPSRATPGADRAVSPLAQEQTPSPSPAPQGAEDRRRQAVKDWLAYRAQQGRSIGAEADRQPGARQDIEDLRRKAVEAWRSLRAKEGESPGREMPRRELDAEPHSTSEQPSGDRGPDLSL